MFGYCLTLLLVFDFAFSSLTRGDEQKRASRIADPVYDHGFAARATRPGASCVALTARPGGIYRGLFERQATELIAAAE